MRSSFGQLCPERGAHRPGKAGSVFRVERALLDLRVAVRDLLDAQQYAVPVELPEGDRPQDEEVQRPGTSVALSTTVLS
jgi:hypothetical protein